MLDHKILYQNGVEERVNWFFDYYDNLLLSYEDYKK